MLCVPAMNGKGARRLLGLTFALTVCLLAPACRTNRVDGEAAGERPASSAAADNTIRKLNEIVIPEMTFFPPATIIDAVDFLKQASLDYDKPEIPLERRGVGLVLHLSDAPVQCDPSDPFAAVAAANCVVPKLAAMSVRFISLYDALKIVCDVTDMKMRISQEGTVRIKPKWGDLDEDWCTRSYVIPEALSARLFSPAKGSGSDVDPNKVWQAFFEELGVAGPECARFEYLPVINKLRVTNTPENLAIIESVFDAFALRMVEMEVQIQAFRVADIERLRLSDGVSVESLTALRQKGRSKPVASATALTKSGQEANVKAVREVIYPTELLTDSEQTGSNLISRSAAKALMPGSFEVRETGMTLQVVPEVETGGSEISLMLNPTWITLDGWETYPAGLAAGWTHKTLPFKQPVFGLTSFQTQATVEDGETVLLGSCSTPDGEWVQVGFLTARLRDVRPRLPNVWREMDARSPRDHGKRKDVLLAKERCQSVDQKLREIVIPELTLRPPATILDAVRFFKDAAVIYDKPEIPEAQRGLSFVLKPPMIVVGEGGMISGDDADPFAAPVSDATNVGASVIPALSARFISLYDALKLVCDVTGMKFRIRDGIIWIVPMGEPEDALITQVYLASLTSMHERVNGAVGRLTDDDNKRDLRSFFAQLGVDWPEGSSVSYVPSLGAVRVTNIPENIDVFEQVLADLNVFPTLVELEVQIVAFPVEEVEKNRLPGDLSVEALTVLRRAGRAKPVASATVLTKSGQEAVMKSLREVIYPTDFLTESSQADVGGRSKRAAGALVPGNFEMREVGMILQVVPEISVVDASLINVMLKPQWVTLDRWESYPADLAAGWTHKALPFRQPVFGVTSWQTQVTVKDGGTVLLGSNTTPDGKWVQVGFLTARRVNVQSENSKSQP